MSIVDDFPAALAMGSGSGEQSVFEPARRLELRIRPCEGYTIIGVWGELRAGTTGRLSWLLKTLMRTGCSRVLLDLSRLYDLDADALTELDGWQSELAAAGGGLWLAAPRPWVRRLFEHMCLRGTFTLYPTVFEALAEIRPPGAVEDCRAS